MKKITMEEETKWFSLIKEVRGKRVIFDTGLSEIFDLDVEIIRDIVLDNKAKLKNEVIGLSQEEINNGSLYGFTDNGIIVLLVHLKDLLYDFEYESFIRFIGYAFNVLFDYKKFISEDFNLYFTDDDIGDFYSIANKVLSMATKSIAIISTKLDVRFLRAIKELDNELCIEIYAYNDALIRVYENYVVNNSINASIKKMKRPVNDTYFLLDWKEENAKLFQYVQTSDAVNNIYYFVSFQDAFLFKDYFNNVIDN